MTRQPPKRGDIWLTRLDPVMGNEIQKTRPCLVISPDGMNKHLGTVIVMPMTTGSQATRFRLSTNVGGRSGLLLGEQIRSVSRLRLLKHLDRIDDALLSRALEITRDMFEE